MKWIDAFLSFRQQRVVVNGVGAKSHGRAVPAVPSPIWCASNVIFIISSKLTYEVKNCNDIMFLC